MTRTANLKRKSRLELLQVELETLRFGVQRVGLQARNLVRELESLDDRFEQREHLVKKLLEDEG